MVIKLESGFHNHTKNITAEVSLGNFKGCEALSARSYLKGSAEVRKANSLKSVKETTQQQRREND